MASSVVGLESRLHLSAPARRQCSLVGGGVRRNSAPRLSSSSSAWLLGPSSIRSRARVARAGGAVRKCGADDLARSSAAADLGRAGRGELGVRISAGELSSACSCCCPSDVVASANAARRRPGRRNGSRARCEADGAGGGVSYEDRMATIEPDAVDGGGDGFGAAGPDSAVTRSGNSGDEEAPSEVMAGVAARDEEKEGAEDSALDVLKEILRAAHEELENCKEQTKALEERAQRVAEETIALNDEAREGERLANAVLARVEGLAAEEARAMEELEKAAAAKGVADVVLRDSRAKLEEALNIVKAENGTVVNLRPELMDGEQADEELVEATVQVTTERTVGISVAPSAEEAAAADADVVTEKETTSRADTQVTVQGVNADAAVAMASAITEEAAAVDIARGLLRESAAVVERIEGELGRIQAEKVERELELARLGEVVERAKERAAAADENVASAMAEAEQAVAVQLEAAQRVSDAEYARQKADTFAVEAARQASSLAATEAEKLAQAVGKTLEDIEEKMEGRAGEREAEKVSVETLAEKKESVAAGDEAGVDVSAKQGADLSPPEAPAAAAAEKASKEAEKAKEAEQVKEPPLPKASKKRSSRFFSASYFSSEDGEEFSPGKACAEFVTEMRPQLGKIILGVALLFAGGAYMNKRLDQHLIQPEPPAYTTTIDQDAPAQPIVANFKKISRRVVDLVNKIPAHEVNEEEASLFDVLWLLLASVIFVPLFTKIPGGSPVLGYLVAGVLIGPHTVHIIQNVHGTKVIAEFGVVFLLFNIGLELSVDRLSSMKKYVFGLGSAQVLATAAGVGVLLNYISKISGPPAIIIASGLALSSTAVVLQVLQERGESTSRHGRATFSVLLFQDLAVVVLLILIPLLSSSGGVGLKEIGAALGSAGIKAVVAIVGIIASGRLFLRPIYKQMADNHNPEIFAANTLLVVLGTSLLTARAGLSMALGAFLAGLLLAETEFALQVESDIAPYRGLLLGLFFMTVGMSIDPKLLVAKFPEIVGALGLLIVGKTLLVASVGRLFGLSTIAAVRTGLLLAPGGEFAFVAFGEAVNQGIMSSQLSSLLFLVVGLSMALTPWLAAGGQLIAAKFEQQDVRSLLPRENETDDLQGHIIICGFGRVGQIIAQLLSERLIPFVALDVRSDRVSFGRQLDLPVYFGDAGNKEVLHKVGADRAAGAVITLDTPGANYRTVWALCKHFPGVKTFVRAHDVDHGLTLEKAGATAVVPETLEPSLQLAAAVLAQAKVPAGEISSAIDDFRSRHLSELMELSQTGRTSLGYGFSRLVSKPMLDAVKMESDENGPAVIEGTVVAVP